MSRFADAVKSRGATLPDVGNKVGGRRRALKGPAPYRAVGERLELFRLAKSIATHKAFIEKAGIGHSTYADVENGKKPLGMKTAMKLIKRHPELSLDYIYLGRIGTVDDYDLRDKISLALASKRAIKP